MLALVIHGCNKIKSLRVPQLASSLMTIIPCSTPFPYQYAFGSVRNRHFAASAEVANAAIAASRNARVFSFKIECFNRLHLVPHHRVITAKL
eukprot:scaffold31707_cov30-Prasinocladus_malaysianus.AAC.1